jgi:hypothetical protein
LFTRRSGERLALCRHGVSRSLFHEWPAAA